MRWCNYFWGVNMNCRCVEALLKWAFNRLRMRGYLNCRALLHCKNQIGYSEECVTNMWGSDSGFWSNFETHLTEASKTTTRLKLIWKSLYWEPRPAESKRCCGARPQLSGTGSGGAKNTREAEPVSVSAQSATSPRNDDVSWLRNACRLFNCQTEEVESRAAFFSRLSHTDEQT